MWNDNDTRQSINNKFIFCNAHNVLQCDAVMIVVMRPATPIVSYTFSYFCRSQFHLRVVAFVMWFHDFLFICGLFVRDAVTVRKRIFSLIGSWSFDECLRVFVYLSFWPCHRGIDSPLNERDFRSEQKNPYSVRIMYDFIDLFDIKATIADSTTDRPTTSIGIVLCWAHSQTYLNLVIFLPAIPAIYQRCEHWKKNDKQTNVWALIVQWENCGELATGKYLCEIAMIIRIANRRYHWINFYHLFSTASQCKFNWIAAIESGSERESIRSSVTVRRCMRNNNIYSVQTTTYTN